MGKIALLLGLLATAPLRADIYRWVDQNGQVHFGDRPPNPGAEPLNVNPNVAGSQGLRGAERAWLERIEAHESLRRRARDAHRQAVALSGARQRRCAMYRLRLQELRDERRHGCRVSRCSRIDRRASYYLGLLEGQCR